MGLKKNSLIDLTSNINETKVYGSLKLKTYFIYLMQLIIDQKIRYKDYIVFV